MSFGTLTRNAGATVNFVAAPGTNAQNLGSANNRLTFTRNEVDMLEWSRGAEVGFSKPEVWNIEISIDNAPTPHATLLQNFVDAILGGTPLLVPGEEGLHSVELANVMLYSSLLGQTVELPMDSAAFEKKLQELIAQSKFEKRVVEIKDDDFTKSFKR